MKRVKTLLVIILITQAILFLAADIAGIIEISMSHSFGINNLALAIFSGINILWSAIILAVIHLENRLMFNNICEHMRFKKIMKKLKELKKDE